LIEKLYKQIGNTNQEISKLEHQRNAPSTVVCHNSTQLLTMQLVQEQMQSQDKKIEQFEKQSKGIKKTMQRTWKKKWKDKKRRQKRSTKKAKEERKKIKITEEKWTDGLDVQPER
jgi:hypothetical protein